MKDKGKWFQTKWGEISTGFQEKNFYSKGGEAEEQVSQRGGGCSILGFSQGHAEAGSKQPDQAVGIPITCQGVWLGGL